MDEISRGTYREKSGNSNAIATENFRMADAERRISMQIYLSHQFEGPSLTLSQTRTQSAPTPSTDCDKRPGGAIYSTDCNESVNEMLHGPLFGAVLLLPAQKRM